MISENVTIALDGGEQVSAVITTPGSDGRDPHTAIVFAHGAANDMHNQLLIALAQRFAEAGHLSLRFNFPYKEKGRKNPDSQAKLEQTWQAVLAYARQKSGNPPRLWVAAGKSMGGRVASQMAATGRLPVDRLIFLGYPLHPPGKKHLLRDAHLNDISQPMLFFAGTRDPFCDLTLLEPILNRLKTPWQLECIEGGDHSLKVPSKLGISQTAVYDHIFNTAAGWLAETPLVNQIP